MRGAIGKSWLRCSAARAVMIPTMIGGLAIVSPGFAQQSGSVADYRLPDPTRTQAPRVQGPVDPDDPLGTPAIPREERTPSPTVTPLPAPAPAPRVSIPVPQPPPAPVERPSDRRRSRSTVEESVAPQSNTNETATPTPPPSPSPARATSPRSSPELASTSITAASNGADQSATTGEAIPTATTSSSSASSSSWLIPGLLGLLALGGGGALLLRRRRSAQEIEGEPELASTTIPRPPPARAKAVPPVAAPEPNDPATPAVAIPDLLVEPLHLATAFSAKAVRLSLVYATVQYELEIANAGTNDLSALQVRVDLISAHASLSTHDQLAPSSDQLELKHTLTHLPAGESQALKGEVRVPLSQLRPLSKGSGHFLVPLVRFCILAPDGSGIRRVYTVGPTNPGSGTVASVRLDAGPRNLRELDVREIEAARSFTIDRAVVHS